MILMPTTFVFFRHAQGYHNVDGDIRGDIAYNDPIHIDAELTDYGILQAKTKNLGNEQFDEIYCSPMRRCVQTLLNIYPRSELLPVIVDDRLIEQPQGRDACNHRLDKNHPDIITPLRWNTKLVSDVNPFKLNIERDIKNIISFTNDVKNKYPNGKVLVVTHGRWLNNWLMIYKNYGKWFNNCESIRVTL